MKSIKADRDRNKKLLLKQIENELKPMKLVGLIGILRTIKGYKKFL